MATKHFISDGKEYIRMNDIKSLEQIYRDISEIPQNDYQLSGPYIFQQLFTYACQYASQETLIWFIRMYYEIFNDLEKIALRHMFIHGKYVSFRNSGLKKNWYNQCIIPLIKSC